MTGEKVHRLSALYSVTKDRAGIVRARLEELQQEMALAEQASAFLRKASDDVRNALYGRFEALVNLGLKEILGEGLTLRFVKVEKARRIYELPRMYRKLGEELIEVDIVADEAGGVVDIVSFLVRVALLITLIPAPRRFLLLDEPFKMLSANLRPRVGDLLAALTRELGMQIIMTTHSEELAEVADTRYELVDGKIERHETGGLA